LRLYLPFDEWTSIFGSERLTGALLDRLTHHVHILEMNGQSYRLRHLSRHKNTIINRGFKAHFFQPDRYNISPPFGTHFVSAVNR
jgi:IstB-like ATP binding protein